MSDGELSDEELAAMLEKAGCPTALEKIQQDRENGAPSGVVNYLAWLTANIEGMPINGEG